MEEKRTLPDYKNPPVVEVAVNAFFKPLPRLKTAHFGRFWEMHRSEFPTSDDYPPVYVSEPQLLDLPPLRRIFLVGANGTYVVQLQADLFVLNWRKIPLDQQYPHFESIKKQFLKHWQSFQDFVRTFELGNLELTRYELAYINQFVEPQGSFPGALEKYTHLIHVRPPRPEHFLPPASNLAADVRFIIPEGKGTLSVALKNGTRLKDKTDILQLDVIARGDARADGGDLVTWFDIAHTWIVKGFTELTSEEAHKTWGRTI